MKSWNKNRHKRFDLFSAITIMTALLVIFFIGSAISAVIVSGIPCFAETIRSPEVLFAFRLSFTTASISTIIVMALALPTAYALTRTDMPFKRLSGLMIELTLSLPYILLGLSLLIIFSSPAGKWLKGHGFKVVFSPSRFPCAGAACSAPLSSPGPGHWESSGPHLCWWESPVLKPRPCRAAFT